MSKRGQALTEFVLVLPVILIILLVIFNISYVYIEKYNLESDMETITDMYKNGDMKSLGAYTAKEDLRFNEKKTGNLTELKVSKNILISAPILNQVLGKDFKIETSKTIYSGAQDEKQ